MQGVVRHQPRREEAQGQRAQDAISPADYIRKMTLCLIGLTRLIAPDSCPNLGLGLILPYLGL